VRHIFTQSTAMVMAAGLQAQTCQWGALAGQGLTSGTQVRALAAFDDGTGPALFVGGIFRQSLGNPGHNIAKWDGEAWSPLGTGTGTVHSLIVFDDGSGDALYVGGSFARAGDQQLANGIARWNGSKWSTLGSGMVNSGSWPRTVSAMVVFDDGSGPALYVGGRFTEAGGVPALNVARWDGERWWPLGNGLPAHEVRDMVVFDDGTGPAVYAAGASIPSVAKWDGTAWHAVGGDVNSLANRLAVYDGGSGPALYAGGQFTMAGGVPASRIARWDGSAWSPLGSGVSFEVWALHVFDDGSGPGLYVGGSFSSVGGIPTWGVGRWDGAWSALGPGLYNGAAFGPNVFALETFDDGAGPALYVGGEFIEAGGVPANHIARWKCDSCYADCDTSTSPGVLDIFDFLCFQDAFVTMDPYADCDGNSVFDVFDFLCFQDAFVTGCP